MAIFSIIGTIAVVLLGAIALAAVIFLIGKLFGMTFVVLRNIFRFIGEEFTDTLRLIGAVLASILYAPLVVLSIVIGRWSASRHYANAMGDEVRMGGRCIYRLFIGNFARLFGVSKAFEGIEQRIPEMIAAAPTRDKPTKRVGMFEGYKIVGSLKGGGSGSKLYIAEPDEVKQAVFAKRKLGQVEQVVIKVFSLKDGSSLPQIVRESRALDAARSLGLVLEHQMASDRFYYVMRYVPGEALSVVTQRLHGLSSSQGLADEHLRSVMSHAQDLLVALDTYHHAELWHKDVKPDNIIVDGRGPDAKAHLVDFGLVTPMRSSMTLTTHGTEYFRDPELVRQALRGVKVHQIDGSKFDIYGAGAVLFSMIENSFPAHGGLSQITKRCPEALRWIVRRSMAEYDRRYPTAAAMLADLHVVLEAKDPFAVKPIDLPSVSQGDVAAANQIEHERAANADEYFQPVNFGSPVPPISRTPASNTVRVGRPKTKIKGWWSGRYSVESAAGVASPMHPNRATPKPKQARHSPRPVRSRDDRKPAAQQIRDARKRAHTMRANAGKRRASVGRRSSYNNSPGIAVVLAGFIGLMVLGGIGLVGFAAFTPVFHNSQQEVSAPLAQASSVSVSTEDGTTVISIADTTTGQSVEIIPDEQVGDFDVEILMVPLLSSSIDPEAIESLQSQLRAQGLTVLGDLSIDMDNEQVLELTAGLQNAIGSTPIDAQEFTAKVESWLETTTLDGVFVFGQQSNNDHGHALLVLDGHATAIPYPEQTSEHLIGELIANGYTRQ